MEDRNFDDLAEKFAKKIYSDKKGQIRLGILWRDLREFVPELASSESLHVFDAGGGIGQVSAELALQGHRVVLSDPSEKMLEKARIHAAATGVQQGAVDYRHEKVQQHVLSDSQQYDVILFHAVLEWLSDPFPTLENLTRFLKPGGALSLLFYNRHSVVLTNLFKGNFRKVHSGDLGGHKNSLTPINPINPQDVYAFLERAGFELEVISGVRVFNDYMPKVIRDERSLEDTLALESLYCREEPYRSIARYIHLIARAPKATPKRH